MKQLMAIVTVLLASLPVTAQSVELPQEVRGKVGAFVTIPAKTTDTAVSWFSPDAGLEMFPVTLLKDTRTAVVIGQRPGRYRVLAVTAKDNTPSPFAVCTVIIEGDAPNPGPNPQPNPGPNPQPNPEPGPTTDGPIYVVVIEETGEAVAERGRVFADPAIAARFRERNHKFRIVDKDVVGVDGQPPADVRRFIELSRGKKLPQVYLVDKDGRTLLNQDLPTDPSALLALIRKVGG